MPKNHQKRSSNNYFQDIPTLPAYTEVPSMQLSDFMRAYADIDDPTEAYLHLNVISQEAYGELEVSEIDENEDYVISGRMFNPVVRERCIDIFWDLWEGAETLQKAGHLQDVVSKTTVAEVAADASVPEHMLRVVFSKMSFKYSGGSSPTMPYCNKEGYFVFPSPIRKETPNDVKEE